MSIFRRSVFAPCALTRPFSSHNNIVTCYYIRSKYVGLSGHCWSLASDLSKVKAEVGARWDTTIKGNCLELLRDSSHPHSKWLVHHSSLSERLGAYNTFSRFRIIYSAHEKFNSLTCYKCTQLRKINATDHI